MKPPGYLFIVARDRPDVLRAAQERFAYDETILILTDRRQGERRRRAEAYEPDRRRGDRRRPVKFWEDLNVRPCLVVPVQVPTVGGGATSEDSAAPDRREMRITESGIEDAEARQRLDRWRQEGQYLLGDVIPRLLDEHERLRARAETAAQECEQLRAENDVLRAQRASLKGSLEEVRRLLEPMARALQGIDAVVRGPASDEPTEADKARWLRSA